ncbi:MAG TPA: signal peptidase I [Polyangiaceae bacterium]|nr:signal peptidase I [Polyangiaceae bacterium]
MNHVTRKPRLALIAALSMPGLGQLYVGDLPRGLCFLLGVALAVPGAVRLGLLCPSRCLCFVVLLGVTTALALYVWSVVDAVRCARRGAGVALHSWQRPSVYGLYVAASYVFVLAPSTAGVRRDFLEAFVVPSASMSPSILPGDRIFADKTIGQPGGAKLWRGAPVVFIYPNDRTNVFIKRVVGLPGDEIEIAGTDVRVNGHSVSQGPSSEPLPAAFAGLRAFRERGDRGEYTVLWPQRDEPADTAAVPTRFVVPAGQVLVLGDNRAASVDSRRFGTVPVADVKGVARQIWFSVSVQDGVRWGRLGKLLG